MAKLNVMAWVDNGGVRLHVETDGSGEPVTVVGHGLTNSCKELAMLTPLLPGSAVRFSFRGHGKSDAPEAGYRFADFAADLDAVARAYGATRAVGTSLAQGAICRLLAENPQRFERLVFLLPAALDVRMDRKERFFEIADLLETLPKGEAIRRILEREEVDRSRRMPWMREMAEILWDEVNPRAAARAIREVVDDVAVEDRRQLEAVRAPALIICVEGDPIHPVEIGEGLAEVLVNAELRVYRDQQTLVEAVPDLMNRVRELLG